MAELVTQRGFYGFDSPWRNYYGYPTLGEMVFGMHNPFNSDYMKFHDRAGRSRNYSLPHQYSEYSSSSDSDEENAYRIKESEHTKFTTRNGSFPKRGHDLANDSRVNGRLASSVADEGMIEIEIEHIDSDEVDKKSDNKNTGMDSDENSDIKCLNDTWIADLHLNLKDLDELRSGAMLSDKHMNAAQRLLQKQFPHVRGLQDTCLSQTSFHELPSQSLDGVCVQVHHTRGNHWILSVAKDRKFYVYDSLYDKITPDLKTQLISIYGSNLKNDNGIFSVIMPAVKSQKGSKDCGLFVVAYAYEICSGNDPRKMTFDQSKMRKHFEECLENKKLTSFPVL